MHGCAVEKGDSEAAPPPELRSGSNSAPKLPTPRPETLRMGGAPVKALQIIDAARAAGVTLFDRRRQPAAEVRLAAAPGGPRGPLSAQVRSDHLPAVRIAAVGPPRTGTSSSRTGRRSPNSMAGFLDKRLRQALSGPVSSNGSIATRSARRRTAAGWCGGGEREGNVLLPFGIERAGHAWMHSRCWRPWHEHRQAQAIDFLQALGIAAPSKFPNDFAKNGAA